ncbi:hypothetical protein AWC38_SpisGene23101 [Stylophora pistillata]|uniref:Uncharacterized protein n=1 Tax=Stylophora pistillata TaxID=50429 RepID=A0A2B4R5F8_STYPI|nr:hypothetical protein AWC38_SpisGene23101 [Stylophora pistillata]
MNSSQETLVDNRTTFPITDTMFPKVWSPFTLDLAKKKGVFPCDYMDYFEKIKETSLPPKEAFFNTLAKQHISDEAYAHAQHVRNEFGCRILRDYHDVYLATDVFTLADVVEQFRNICMDTYQLDPAHYYISPGLAWDAASRYTQVELDTISDYDMYLFMEHDFQWVPETEFPDVMQVADDASKGYILKVDLEYPEELHDTHNDYPLAPQTKHITPEIDAITLFRSVRKFAEDEGETCFIAVESVKTVLKMIKPIYTGFSKLELFKLWMYQFHYDVILKQYGPEKDRFMFTDTDSPTYHIETEDVYHDMKENEDN